jgi:hypothetical protein
MIVTVKAISGNLTYFHLDHLCKIKLDKWDCIRDGGVQGNQAAIASCQSRGLWGARPRVSILEREHPVGQSTDQ